MRPPFVVPTGELFRQRGARHAVTLAGPLPGLAVSVTRLTGDDVVADVVLEAQGDTVTATGTVTGRWVGECRRCLDETLGDLVVTLSEVFEPEPVEGETYALDPDQLDLEPALREAIVLALPLAPVCAEDCPGPAPDAHPVATPAEDDEPVDAGSPADPRWSALDALRFDE